MKGPAIALASLVVIALLACWRIGAWIDHARAPARELVRVTRAAGDVPHRMWLGVWDHAFWFRHD